jgi:hypothetical protein
MEFTKIIPDGTSNSIMDSYSNSEIKNKTIIRNELTNKFLVFDDKQEFKKWYFKQPDLVFHEVIIGYQTQRLKFDIDISDTVDDIHLIIKTILNTIIKVLTNLYEFVEDIEFNYSDFIITNSSGVENNIMKYSYHIIMYKYGLLDCDEAKYITNCVIDMLPDLYKSWVDKNVNKKIQNFRILLSHKKNSNRIKKIDTLYGTYNPIDLLDTLIIPFKGIRVLHKLVDEDSNIVEDSKINEKIVNDIIQAVSSFNILDGHEFRNFNSNSLNFNRIRPTYCHLCEEIHHKDNSLIIQYNSITNDIYEFCRQCNNSRFITKLSETLIEINTLDTTNNNGDEISKFHSLENKNIYEQSSMRDYELVRTLAIQANMKVGKTKMLKQFVAKNFSNSVIRFITFRQTFSNHVYGLFSSFDLYSNIKGNIDPNVHKKVIIQVESLYRLQLDESINIDLLILDEVESIISQISSGLHKNLNKSLAMFIWMLKSAKHVICMDANLSNRTYNILNKFRDGDIFFHHNTYLSSKDDTYHMTNNKNVWLDQLFDKLSKKKKIVIPVNSLIEAKTCEQLITQQFPSYSVKLFSSEMKHSEKQMYFKDVNKYWTELDVLIYTPTCSAGISYELDNFDYIFGYFMNCSCDVETCRQMLSRVRNIKYKEYFICLQEVKQYNLPTTAKDLEIYLYNKRCNLCNYITDQNLQWTYNLDGFIKFYETDYYHIWLENMVITNKSKNNFISRFCNQIKQCGANIKSMDNIDNSIDINYNEVKADVKLKGYELICNANEITEMEAMDILNRITNQVDVDRNEFNSYEKYKIRNLYNNFTGKILVSYVPKDVQYIYKNLCDISHCSTIEESITRLIKMEQERYINIVSNTSSYKNKVEYYDLHNDGILYTSLSHIIVSKILTYINTGLTYENYTNIVTEHITPILEQNERYINCEFNISLQDDKRKTVNKLLKKMYGLRICKKGNTVKLKNCTIFIFSKFSIEDKITIITYNNQFLLL